MSATSAAPTELGTLKIGKLLKMYAVPGIIAQTAASLYNMVDSIYIGHIPGVGSSAISGLAVTFPLMNLSVAFGTLVGVGAMALLSILLGERNYSAASKVLGNVFSLSIIIGVVFTALALSYLEPILSFFGASEVTMPYAKDYMRIIIWGNIITHMYFGFNGLIRSAGHPRTAMGLTLFTVASNAILDPIFIFGLGLGIKGAAYATIICQAIALCYTLRFFSDKRKFLHFPRPIFQLDLKIASRSLSIGMAPFLLNAAACLVAMFINQQLGKYGGDLSIGAYGIVNRITMLFVMICMGFNQGLQPIAGYNYGARLYGRVREVFFLTAKWETLVTTLCFLVSVFIPELVVSLFTDDAEMVALASKGLTVMNIGFAFVGFSIVVGNTFQCLGMVKTAIFLSLTRQIIFLLPLIYFLPLLWGEKGVWYSFVVSDIVSIIIAFIFIARLLRRMARLRDGDEPVGL